MLLRSISGLQLLIVSGTTTEQSIKTLCITVASQQCSPLVVDGMAMPIIYISMFLFLDLTSLIYLDDLIVRKKNDKESVLLSSLLSSLFFLLAMKRATLPTTHLFM